MVSIIWNLDEIIFDEVDDFIRPESDHCAALSPTNSVMFGDLMGLMLLMRLVLSEAS